MGATVQQAGSETVAKQQVSVAAIALTIGSLSLAGVVLYKILSIFGTNDTLAAGFATSPMAAFQPVHERFEALLRVRKAQDYQIYPTKPTFLMFLYGPAIVTGLAAAVPTGIGGILAAIARFELLDQRGILLVFWASSLLFFALLPTSLYLAGEYIGRHSKTTRVAVLVGLLSSLAFPIWTWANTISTFSPLLSVPPKSTSSSPKNSASMDSSPSKSTTPVDAAKSDESEDASLLALGSMIDLFIPGGRDTFRIFLHFNSAMLLTFFLAPVLIGSIRGAKHKKFYDLAFFAREVGDKRRGEIEDFVLMLAQEYQGEKRGDVRVA